MTKAIWNNTTIADSDETVVVENNHYFPSESVKTQYVRKNGQTYECPWKGHADYYDVIVSGVVSESGAWSYPDPKEAAKQIKGYFAFWKGVKVIK